jgi:hypothetical protein
MPMSAFRQLSRTSSTATTVASSSSDLPLSAAMAVTSTLPQGVKLCFASTYSRRARNRHIELYKISLIDDSRIVFDF